MLELRTVDLLLCNQTGPGAKKKAAKKARHEYDSALQTRSGLIVMD